MKNPRGFLTTMCPIHNIELYFKSNAKKVHCPGGGGKGHWLLTGRNPGAAWHYNRALEHERTGNLSLAAANNAYGYVSRVMNMPNPTHRRNPAKSNLMNLLVLAGVGFLVYKLVKNRA